MRVITLSEYVDSDVAGVELLVIPDEVDTPEFVVKAHAKRDPIDKPDENVAILLAYGRAYEKIAKKLLKRASGLVRHNDYVREYRREQRNTKKSLVELATDGEQPVRKTAASAKLTGKRA